MTGQKGSSKQAAYPRRRRKLMRKVRAAKLHALLVSNDLDVSYLTGFTGDSSYLLVAERFTCLVTDGRYVEQAHAECGEVEIHVRGEALAPAVARVIRGRGIRRLGVQAEHMTLAARKALATSVGEKRIRSTSQLVARLRRIKDEFEIKAVRRAVRIAEKAFRRLIAPGARALVGRTERRVAAELDHLMRLAGADVPAFETIVAAGAHSSLPHYRPAGRKIRCGDAVLIDFGARAAGYASDLTRVLFIGRIPRKLREPYEVVRRAQQAALAAIRPGVACKTIDAAAREVIAAAGYGDRFAHGVGHGLGRAVHEGPGLGKSASGRLRMGMVVTVEPGIYLPGVGGIRIEDDVQVTADGRRRLSTLPRAAATMVLH